MPASRSTAHAPEPTPSSPLRWPLIVVGLLIVAGFVLSALPASLLARLLPAQVSAQDFSGTLWHGSAAHISVLGRSAGAAEWRIHPGALWSLTLEADVHWVKTSSVYDARVKATRNAAHAFDVHGGGPLDDLRDFGLAPGWRGSAQVALSEIATDFTKLTKIAGSIEVSALSSPTMVGGSDLGSYQLNFAPDALDADGNINAVLKDTGGPLEAQAQISFAPATGTGLLSGTLRERATASPALREQLANLAQMKPRDAQGRIPVELEFRF